MDVQTFSKELSQHLSSLAPEFEGHYGYYKFYDDSVSVACHEEIWWVEKHREFTQVRRKKPDLICPAWRVEDVLRNLHTILPVEKKIEIQWLPGGANPYAFVSEEICKLLRIKDQDTAYQKIEEYLWEILK